MKTIRFGIIGAGNIANKFCEAAKLADCAEVTAVASKSMERAQAFAERNGGDFCSFGGCGAAAP